MSGRIEQLSAANKRLQETNKDLATKVQLLVNYIGEDFSFPDGETWVPTSKALSNHYEEAADLIEQLTIDLDEANRVAKRLFKDWINVNTRLTVALQRNEEAQKERKVLNEIVLGAIGDLRQVIGLSAEEVVE